jgi:hypothetical protein
MEDLRLRLRPLAIRVDGRYHRGRIWEPRPDSAATELGAVSNATTTPPPLRRDVLARRRRRERPGGICEPPAVNPANLLLVTSRSLAALVAQHSFPNGTGILGRLSLLDRAESGSLAESAARATKQEHALVALDANPLARISGEGSVGCPRARTTAPQRGCRRKKLPCTELTMALSPVTGT